MPSSSVWGSDHHRHPVLKAQYCCIWWGTQGRHRSFPWGQFTLVHISSGSENLACKASVSLWDWQQFWTSTSENSPIIATACTCSKVSNTLKMSVKVCSLFCWHTVMGHVIMAALQENAPAWKCLWWVQGLFKTPFMTDKSKRILTDSPHPMARLKGMEMVAVQLWALTKLH